MKGFRSMGAKKRLIAAFVVLVVSCQAKQPDTQGAAPISVTDPQENSNPSRPENITAGNAMESQGQVDNIGQQPITDAGRALLSVLKPGMAYADFRKLVLENGWTPVVTPECQANVVGGDHESVCKTNPDQISCRVCVLMPELDSYSGDGYSLVRFRHAGDGEQIEATSYGMIEDWNVAGDESRLQVVSWEFAGSPTK